MRLELPHYVEEKRFENDPGYCCYESAILPIHWKWMLSLPSARHSSPA